MKYAGYGLLVVFAFLLFGTLDVEALTVYSGRKEKAIKPVIDVFREETGLDVKLKVGKTGGFINQLVQEKAHPIADVFVATTAGAVEAARKHDLFASYHSPHAENVPAEFKSSDGTWTGISGRARILLYNKELLSEDEVPTSVLSLVDPKWKGKMAIAATRERTTLAWLSAFLETFGRDNAKTYMDGLLGNQIAILPDNSNVRRAVGEGEFLIGLTNSPNYFLTRDEGLPVGFVFPDQGDGEMGVLINPNTVSIVKGAKHMDEAKQLVDFLLSDQAAQILATSSYEIPLRPGIQAGEVTRLDEIKVIHISQERLGEIAEETKELFPDF